MINLNYYTQQELTRSQKLKDLKDLNMVINKLVKDKKLDRNELVKLVNGKLWINKEIERLESKCLKKAIVKYEEFVSNTFNSSDSNSSDSNSSDSNSS